jgi:L-iditol 2-dehydrogenase
MYRNKKLVSSWHYTYSTHGLKRLVYNLEKHVDVPIVGHEITCYAVETGKGVQGINKGDRFAIQTVIGCGECVMCKVHRENLCEKGFKAMGYQWNGGYAEYIIMPKVGVDQGCLIPIPDDMTAEAGTIIEPLSCCINGMRPIPLEETGHVLVYIHFLII